MDTYADDLLQLFEHLDLKEVMMVGHSTGGGEVARFIGRHGTSRVKKAVLVGAVPPLMVQTDFNPKGLPAIEQDRSKFFRDVPTGPFFGFNRPGAIVSQGLIDSWWQQGMQAGFKNAYDCIKAFSETDQREDLNKMDIPVLLLHGDDDQVVPIKAAAEQAIKLLPNGTL
ncbi:Non-heme chloroperoxidase [Cladobotryum mycophilum]|uniref:Non-heme chloroperoxidase n=1 Tax=Cladobotryum mycophilum TaxID=491253 RepID=A0ABR0SBJ3_9HYPO